MPAINTNGANGNGGIHAPTTNTPWMTQEQLDKLNEWDKNTTREKSDYEMCDRIAKEVRNAAQAIISDLTAKVDSAMKYRDLCKFKDQRIRSLEKKVSMLGIMANNTGIKKRSLAREFYEYRKEMTAKVEELKVAFESADKAAFDWNRESIKLTNENATLKGEVETLKHRRRWNVEEYGNGQIGVCIEDHHRADDCTFVRYYPESDVERLKVEKDTLSVDLIKFAIDNFIVGYFGDKAKHIKLSREDAELCYEEFKKQK